MGSFVACNVDSGNKRCVISPEDFMCMLLIEQCEYESVEEACELCSQKGIPCGVEDKVWGPTRAWKRQGKLLSIHPEIPVANAPQCASLIPRQLPTPDDEELTRFDGMNLQKFLTSEFPLCLQRPFKLLLDVPSSIARRYGINVRSKPVRNAIFLFSSLAPASHELSDYFGNYCRFTSQAISERAYPDVLYACYLMIVYSDRVRRSFDEICSHARGFFLTLRALDDHVSLTGEEACLAKALCVNVLGTLTVATEKEECTETRLKALDEVIELIDLASRFLLTTNSVGSTLHVHSVWNGYLKATFCRLRLLVLFQRYAFGSSVTEQPFARTLSLDSDIRSALNDFYIAVGEFPVFRAINEELQRTQPTAIQLVALHECLDPATYSGMGIGRYYGFFLLYFVVFDQPSESDREIAVKEALAVSQFANSYPRDRFRLLFLSGMILIKYSAVHVGLRRHFCDELIVQRKLNRSERRSAISALKISRTTKFQPGWLCSIYMSTESTICQI